VAIQLRSLERSELDVAAQLLARSCEYDRVDAVAEEVLFGRAPSALTTRVIVACTGETICGLAATSGRWLRVLAVTPDMRSRGIGTALIAAAEASVIADGHDLIRILDQPGNYLAPGVDTRNSDTIAWLTRRGYESGARNTNLLIDVRGNPKVSEERLQQLKDKALARGYTLSRAQPEDAPAISATIGNVFSEPWAFEIERAIRFEPSGLHVAHDADGSLAAFAAHDGNNAGLGWFGPAGTMEQHRGKGLGAALLMACLVDVARDHDQCTVAWIGPREFYDRVAGIASERHFRVMRKPLSES